MNMEWNVSARPGIVEGARCTIVHLPAAMRAIAQGAAMLRKQRKLMSTKPQLFGGKGRKENTQKGEGRAENINFKIKSFALILW